MNIETSPEFETWFASRFWHECYEDVKHHLFAAWQASRKELTIELPELRGDSDADDIAGVGLVIPMFDRGYDEAINLCREAIQLTGAKVK